MFGTFYYRSDVAIFKDHVWFKFDPIWSHTVKLFNYRIVKLFFNYCLVIVIICFNRKCSLSMSDKILHLSWSQIKVSK